MKLTGVSWHFNAAHRRDGGELHGHTWIVKAVFPAGSNALDLQARLRESLRRFDHTTLPNDLSEGEDLAEAIGSSLADCVRVEIARPPEGIFAEWHRD